MRPQCLIAVPRVIAHQRTGALSLGRRARGCRRDPAMGRVHSPQISPQIHGTASRARRSGSTGAARDRSCSMRGGSRSMRRRSSRTLRSRGASMRSRRAGGRCTGSSEAERSRARNQSASSPPKLCSPQRVEEVRLAREPRGGRSLRDHPRNSYSANITGIDLFPGSAYRSAEA
jgi:hypothetical protein